MSVQRCPHRRQTEVSVLSCHTEGRGKKGFKNELTTLHNVSYFQIDNETLEPKSKLAQETIEWCKEQGSKSETLDEVLRNPDTVIMEAIQAGIDRYNKRATSNAQKIQKWTILPTDFSIPGGEIGPTMKVKRHYVLKKYVENVEKLYS